MAVLQYQLSKRSTAPVSGKFKDAVKIFSARVDLQVSTHCVGDFECLCKIRVSHDQVAVRQERLAPVAAWRANGEQVFDNDVLTETMPQTSEAVNGTDSTLATGPFEYCRSVVAAVSGLIKLAMCDCLRPA